MAMLRLYKDFKDLDRTIAFLQEKGLIHKEKLCRNGHSMKLRKRDDRYRWRCHNASCLLELGLREGTWFNGSKYPLNNAILFIYSWTKKYTTTLFCKDELSMSAETVTNWKNYLREVCADSLLKNPLKIGGYGMTVEIDESCFTRRKHNVGRIYPNQWVFGGICRETKKSFIYSVPNRNKDTLIACIKECILPGSVIISDLWKAYSTIERIEGYDFKHYTVNHSENFVDPSTGAHTHSIESLWAAAKIRNKIEAGTRRTMLDSYLCEFMWRQRNMGKDLFEVILEDIASFCIKLNDNKVDPREALENCKVNPTSDLGALLHVIKSSLGTGVLAIANGFKNAGLLLGVLGTILIGILCTHCSYIMVKSAQDLCQILNRPFLGYTETVEQAMLNCAKKKFSHYARCAKNTADMFMFCTYYGVNTVYIIFVATTIQHITENQFNVTLNVRFCILAVAVPVFFIGMVRSMKYLVPFSLIANLFLLTGLCLTFYYILQDLPPIGSRSLVSNITHWPLFISTALFGLEGIGTMLPIENSMKNPNHFLHFPGVLIIAMVIVVSLFVSVGFLGYLKYGDDIKDSITLNLPKYFQAEAVKVLAALAVLFTYGLQLTASMEVIWKRLEKHFDDEMKCKRYYQVRAALIFGTVVIALIVPNLGPVISLIGAFGFSMCGFFYPALVQIIMNWDGDLGKWNYILWKNGFLILFAIVATLTGSTSAILDIIKEYQ